MENKPSRVLEGTRNKNCEIGEASGKRKHDFIHQAESPLKREEQQVNVGSQPPPGEVGGQNIQQSQGAPCGAGGRRSPQNHPQPKKKKKKKKTASGRK